MVNVTRVASNSCCLKPKLPGFLENISHKDIEKIRRSAAALSHEYDISKGG
jgi:hypothetical protein